VCLYIQKNNNNRIEWKTEQNGIVKLWTRKIKRNLSGAEGGNCSNIYKHEIYISIAVSCAAIFDDVMYVYGDSFWSRTTYTQRETKNEQKINSIFHLMSQKKSSSKL
jgi:hypothetical protein